MMRKLNIQSFYQFMLIMMIFAITGSLSLYITVELFQFIGLQAENLNPIIFWPIRIILLFIIYQVLLLLVALPFGQFQYFWKFEKKFLNRFGFKL
ncbi:hypothetical protein OA530_03330 [Pelagibacteraceae bacterium]|nr:hypothetical protein [Pelagibacteraceae bacterium]